MGSSAQIIEEKHDIQATKIEQGLITCIRNEVIVY